MIQWYVIVRKDNGYPLQIYADKELAEQIARANGEKVVPVTPVTK
jgi:hypothetical protein